MNYSDLLCSLYFELQNQDFLDLCSCARYGDYIHPAKERACINKHNFSNDTNCSRINKCSVNRPKTYFVMSGLVLPSTATFPRRSQQMMIWGVGGRGVQTSN